MTVADLIALLSGYNPDREVIVAVDAFEWRGISKVDRPLDDPEDDVQRAVCIVVGGERR